ncbi:MAG TPA: hypothetical protein DDY37_01470 [Legionella sp.]|nr:hypothetical protein [Legionella sp.]
MNIYELRNIISAEIVDFNQLSAALSHYAHPRGKISAWLTSGELIRVKKGLYVFGRAACRYPYSIELLANLVYGPSAISLRYALSYYGLIPETVHTITSITSKRNKRFSTPVGDFTYRYLPPAKYTIGIQIEQRPHHTHFLMASPEKALCDTIMLSEKNLTLASEDALEAFLFDDLRMDEEAFKTLSMPSIQQIADCYHNPRLTSFSNYAQRWVKNHASSH